MMEKAMIVLADETDPYLNLAAEELLMTYRRASTRCLFLWQSRKAVVIGRFQNPWKECAVEAMKAEGVALVRRKSGGGAVYQDMGNVNYSLIADTASENEVAVAAMLRLFAPKWGLEAICSGRNDILVEGKKISGQAFRNTERGCLCHGTLLVSVDKSNLERYLTVNSEKLKAKGIDSVRTRVANLRDFVPEMSVESVIREISALFKVEWTGATIVSCREALRTLMGENYLNEWQAKTSDLKSEAWSYGRSPALENSREGHFPWGHVVLKWQVKGGIISEVIVETDALAVTVCEAIMARLAGCPYFREAILLRFQAMADGYSAAMADGVRVVMADDGSPVIRDTIRDVIYDVAQLMITSLE